MLSPDRIALDVGVQCMLNGELSYMTILRFWGFDSSPPDTPQAESSAVSIEKRPQFLEYNRQLMLQINNRAAREIIVACSVFLYQNEEYEKLNANSPVYTWRAPCRKDMA
jgi:hypothetical protein